MKPVGELLKVRGRPVVSVTPDTTVFDAIKLLAEKDIGALLVMKDNQLLGVFSERDYTRKIALAGKNSRETRVSEVMTSKVYFVRPDMRTRECLALMSEKRFRHLPVVENDKVVGMVSMRDIMDDIIADNEFTIQQLEAYIMH